jgi:hypothetical protein
LAPVRADEACIPQWTRRSQAYASLRRLEVGLEGLVEEDRTAPLNVRHGRDPVGTAIRQTFASEIDWVGEQRAIWVELSRSKVMAGRSGIGAKATSEAHLGDGQLSAEQTS